jgi:hypothetical protein
VLRAGRSLVSAAGPFVDMTAALWQRVGRNGRTEVRVGAGAPVSCSVSRVPQSFRQAWLADIGQRSGEMIPTWKSHWV